eukprot:scaffold2231_cov122-Skeletonema_menzelii.AAC.1
MGYHYHEEQRRCWDFSTAELGSLFRKERSAYRYKIFPQHKENSILIHWRYKICDWCYEFIDHYNFDREVVGVAIYYFDHYISSQSSCESVHTKAKFQIIAVTSLFLAIKIHSTSEECLVESRSRALSRLLYDHVDPQEIYEMEMDILVLLDWRLNPPTLHQFAVNFTQLHPLGDCCSTTTSYLYEATRYQVELAIFSPELLAAFTSSIIAYAALKNAEEKIAADNPHILTDDMQQSFEALMRDPSMTIDSVAAARCQLSLKMLCPQLPGIDDFSFSDTYTDTEADSTDVYVREENVHISSISPPNVAY